MQQRTAVWWVAMSITGLTAVGSAQTGALDETMLDFHDRLHAARDALVFPDLETFRGNMRYLSESQPALAKLPAAQRGHVKQVQRLAKKAQTAPDLAAEAKLLGRITAECGGCHRDGKAGPAFPQASMPEETRNAREHMDRYRWALERLWEGLASGATKTWQAGARELREGTLSLDTLPEAARGDEAKKWTRQLHGLAAQADRAKSSQTRANLLGQIVHTCGRCHSETGVTEAGGD